MSLLNKLEEKLNKLDGDKGELAEREQPEQEEKVRVTVQSEEVEQQPMAEIPKTEELMQKQWKEVKEPISKKISNWWDEKKRVFAIAGSIFIVCVLIVSVVIYIFRDSYFIRTYVFQEVFREKDVSLAIVAQKKIIGGQEVDYVVKFSNMTKVDLENVTLSLMRPEDFNLTSEYDKGVDVITWNIGKVAAKSDGRVEFKGIINAPKGASRSLDFELKYQPANLGSPFTTTAKTEVIIENTSLNLTLNVSNEVVVGQQIQYTIDCLNDGDSAVEGLELRVEYPEGFSFVNSDPKASKDDDVWQIGTLSKLQVFQISIEGVLNGKETDVKPLRVMIGREAGTEFEIFKEELKSSTLIYSPLVLSQKVNSKEVYNANPGETLNFAIQYRNDTSLSINNLKIYSALEDINNVLDFASLKINNGGKYDSSSQMITWQVSDNSNLAILNTGDSGEVSFSINVKNYLPITSFNSKNYSILSRVLLEGANMPISIGAVENSLVIKINSKLILQAAGFYNDSKLVNYGPPTPTVGETTAYAIHWNLLNLANELNDVVVEGTLPGDVQWTGATSCKSGTLEYNVNTRKVSWKISNLSTGIGMVLPPEECIFQIKITPELYQKGTEMVLLKNISGSAKDSFTGVNLNNPLVDITTRTLQDVVDGKVQ